MWSGTVDLNVHVIFLGTPSEKATFQSKYSRTLNRRQLLNLTLGLKVSVISFCHSAVCTYTLCISMYNYASHPPVQVSLVASYWAWGQTVAWPSLTGRVPSWSAVLTSNLNMLVTSKFTVVRLLLRFVFMISCLPVSRSSGLTPGSLCVSLRMNPSSCCATYQRKWLRPRSTRKRSQRMG